MQKKAADSRFLQADQQPSDFAEYCGRHNLNQVERRSLCIVERDLRLHDRQYRLRA
jgi:hypothetical protein